MSAELPPEEFRRCLLRMKHEGCSTLVSCHGGLSTVRASRRVLGSAPSYSRVLVSAAGRDALCDRLPRGVTVDSDSVAVVDYREVFAASAEPAAAAEALREEVCEAVEAFRTDGTLGPGELRLHLDAVGRVVDEVGRGRALDLIADVTDPVRDACGMAYYLADDCDVETRNSLSAFCDAEVEVRVDGGDVYQRWHLPGRGSTPWLHM